MERGRRLADAPRICLKNEIAHSPEWSVVGRRVRLWASAAATHHCYLLDIIIIIVHTATLSSFDRNLRACVCSGSRNNCDVMYRVYLSVRATTVSIYFHFIIFVFTSTHRFGHLPAMHTNGRIPSSIQGFYTPDSKENRPFES